jgi:hypothetical protein
MVQAISVTQFIKNLGAIALCIPAFFLMSSCSPQAEKVNNRSEASESPKSKFSISAPKTGRTGTSILISWETVPGAVSYDLILGRDKRCEKVVFKLEYLDKTSQSVTLTEAGNYFICVTSRDNKGVITHAKNIGLPITILGLALQAGAFTASTSVTATSFVLRWTAATADESSPTSQLEYYLCSASSAELIDTVAECKAAQQEMNWVADISTFSIASKSPSTTYFYNLARPLRWPTLPTR